MADKYQHPIHDGVDMDLFELFSAAWAIIAEHKRWVLLTPIIFAFAGFMLARLAIPKWEATANLRVDLEPAIKLIDLSATTEFREKVLIKCGVAPETPDATLYLQTLRVRLHRTNVLEVRAQSYSKDAAQRLVSTSAEDLKNAGNLKLSEKTDSAEEAARAATDILRSQLARTKRAAQDIRSLAANRQNNPGENPTLQTLSIYFDLQLVNEVLALQKQLDNLQLNNGVETITYFSGLAAPDAPIYPKPRLWTIGAGFFGLFLSIAIPLGRCYIGSIR